MNKTETMIKALRVLSKDIQSGDGVANACVSDAADMIENMSTQLAKANERVSELELENINGNAASELLIWWAQKLSNAPNEDLKEVIRIGYKRIVNLANLIGEEQLRKEQE